LWLIVALDARDSLWQGHKISPLQQLGQLFGVELPWLAQIGRLGAFAAISVLAMVHQVRGVAAVVGRVRSRPLDADGWRWCL
jgi:hypothetical protein